MDATEKNQLIRDWIAFHHAKEETPEYESHRWAEQALSNLSHENPDVCLDLIIDILKQDTSDRVIANLAAGPIEDMLTENGEIVIDRIEELATTNLAFKKILGGVWLDDIPESINSRIKAVRGVSW